MLLNLFFENINGKLELFLVGLFIFALYWFVMRKYNTLGLRMLILCVLLFFACSFWLYNDEVKLKHTIASGEEHVAIINSKEIVGSKKDNSVEVTFTDKNGKVINTKTQDYVSKEEWDKFETGKPLSVLYVADKDKTYVQQSIMRFKADKIVLYFFAGFWLVLGAVLYFWLRKYKVKVDDSGNEWLERKDGTTLLDERKSAVFRAAKHGNMISKMIQIFGK